VHFEVVVPQEAHKLLHAFAVDHLGWSLDEAFFFHMRLIALA
jgi:hypothetical protein